MFGYLYKVWFGLQAHWRSTGGPRNSSNPYAAADPKVKPKLYDMVMIFPVKVKEDYLK